ncbi:MAG: hypothetical protein J6A04_01060 [Clostridia bacterium]|nr:hypothetical protein [Clostridia bacterium]
MPKIFHIILRWERGSLEEDKEYTELFGDSLVAVYDGYFIYQDNHRIIGYTDNGILVGAPNQIMETACKWAYIFPIEKEEYIVHGARITFYKQTGHIVMQLEERTYSHKTESLIMQRTYNRSKSLSSEVQQALKKFYQT